MPRLLDGLVGAMFTQPCWLEIKIQTLILELLHAITSAMNSFKQCHRVKYWVLQFYLLKLELTLMLYTKRRTIHVLLITVVSLTKREI